MKGKSEEVKSKGGHESVPRPNARCFKSEKGKYHQMGSKGKNTAQATTHGSSLRSGPVKDSGKQGNLVSFSSTLR